MEVQYMISACLEYHRTST